MANFVPLTETEQNEWHRLIDEGRADPNPTVYVVRFLLNGYNAQLNGHVAEKRINVIRMVHYWDVPKAAIDYILQIRPELTAIKEKMFMIRSYKHKSRPVFMREVSETEVQIWIREQGGIRGPLVSASIEGAIEKFNGLAEFSVSSDDFERVSSALSDKVA